MGVLVNFGWISFAISIHLKSRSKNKIRRYKFRNPTIQIEQTCCLTNLCKEKSLKSKKACTPWIPDETSFFFEPPSISIQLISLHWLFGDSHNGLLWWKLRSFFYPPTSLYLYIEINQWVESRYATKPSVKYAKATRRWYFQKPVKTSWVVFEWLGNLVKPWQGGVIAAVSPCAFFTQLFSFFQFGIYVGCAKKFNGNSLKIIVTTIHY